MSIIDRVTSPLDDDKYNYAAGNFYEYGSLWWFILFWLKLIPAIPFYLTAAIKGILLLVLSVLGQGRIMIG